MTNGQELTPEERLDNSIRLLSDVGFTGERLLSQLVMARHPLDLIKSRFPNVPAHDFPSPAPQRAPRYVDSGPAVTTHSNSARLPVGQAARLRPLAESIATLATHNVATLPARATATSAVDSSEGISFQYVPLIQCSFPHGDPGELSTFSRRNGWLELTLATNRPSMGLPYGVPARLLTIFLASEAIRTRNPQIALGSSIHDFLRRLDVPITRGDRGSLRVYANQLLRLIHSSVSIDENIRDSGGRTGLHIRQALFAEEARLWWDEGEGVADDSYFVLSHVLFQSILERSAPLSTAAIKALRKSPMDLDVYAWLVHRLCYLSRPSQVTWQQLSDQFGHSYSELRYFRRFFTDSLSRVLTVYPEAKLTPNEHGLLLLPSRPHVAKTLPRKSAAAG